MNQHPDAPTYSATARDPHTGRVALIDSYAPIQQRTIDALLLVAHAFTVPSVGQRGAER